MKSFSDKIKSVIIVGVVLLLGVASAIRLMKIQIVGDEEIVADTTNNDNDFVYTKSTKATRGEIVDYSDNLIVGNNTSTNIVLQKALFPEDNDKGNAILLKVYNELKSHGYTVEQNLPISETSPYVFTDGDTAALISDLNLNVYATAEDCMAKLIDDYDISDDYSESEKRIIAGIRYEMEYQDFSYNNDFVLAEDVDSETVIELKEMSNFLRGVDAVETATREIVRGDILPHEIGVVGPIYAEEYEELSEEGYALNDVVGKNGIELAMETELRGQNGEEKVTISNESISDVETVTEAVSGETVKLTVNGTYQLKLQNILDSFLANFQNINTNTDLKDVNSGAIVVLDAKTGAVKGMVTAPTYNLIDYQNDYESILNAENSPLVNRATYGLYRPGSTFKTITATAGLNEGVVNGETSFFCGHTYKFIDTTYECTGSHGYISVTKALEVSCNIYFYELSQKLGIDTITEYAQLYGLGQHTGIETGDAAGYLANPETFVANGQNWYVGYVLQAGIGNIDCGMTPLQMAVVANTIANEGVRYQPYLVDSLYEYGTDNVVSKTEPTVAETIELNYDYVYDYIREGMIDASHNVPTKYSLSDLGFDVAIKTGTPQTGDNGEQNSFFIGFAPADDPEIAFAGVIEGGDYSKYMIRDIILAYQQCYGLAGVEPTAVLDDNFIASVDTATTTSTSSDGTASTQTVVTTAATVSEGDASSLPDDAQTATQADADSETATLPPETPASTEPQPETQSE
jgi:penicillin-binding protein 2